MIEGRVEPIDDADPVPATVLGIDHDRGHRVTAQAAVGARHGSVNRDLGVGVAGSVLVVPWWSSPSREVIVASALIGTTASMMNTQIAALFSDVLATGLLLACVEWLTLPATSGAISVAQGSRGWLGRCVRIRQD